MGSAAGKPEGPASRSEDAGSVSGRTAHGSVSGGKIGAGAVPAKSSGSAEVKKDAESVPGTSLNSSTSVIKGSDEMLDSYTASSEEVFDWFCQPCDTVGQHVEAMGFCNDCAEYLCKTCYSSHRKQKPSRDHLLLLLDKNQMPKSKTPSSIFPTLTQHRQDTGNMSKSNQRIPEASQPSTPSRQDSKSNQLIPEVSQSLARPRRDLGALRANLVGSINVKADNDQKDCWITGCAILGTGHIVVVDHNNESVKLIHVTQGKMISVVSLSEAPRDITETESGLVAVTLHSGIIQLMSVVSNTLTPLRKFKVNGACSGIVYNKGRLMVSFIRPGEVEVTDMQGVVLRTIEANTNGERLFSDWPQYLAISPDGATVYISDFRNHTVISVTTDGQVKAKYTDDQLSYPTGLTVAPDGTVYVCGGGSKNIHQLTADLTKIQVILSRKDGLYMPQSIWYSDQDCKLYVGNHNTSIQVFHLQ